MITFVKPRKQHSKHTSTFLKWQELIVLAADLSPSMNESFRMPNFRVMTRLDALKEAASMYLTHKAAASQHTQVCVIGFDYRAKLIKDWAALFHLPDVLTAISSLANIDGSTNIAGALEMGLDRIAQFPLHPQVRRLPNILLVTDGAGNVDVHKHEILLNRARAEGVRVYTIAICNRRDNPQSYDRDFLFRLARETRGRFTTAQSVDQLKQALASVR